MIKGCWKHRTEYDVINELTIIRSLNITWKLVKRRIIFNNANTISCLVGDWAPRLLFFPFLFPFIRRGFLRFPSLFLRLSPRCIHHYSGVRQIHEERRQARPRGFCLVKIQMRPRGILRWIEINVAQLIIGRVIIVSYQLVASSFHRFETRLHKFLHRRGTYVCVCTPANFHRDDL